MTMHVLCEAHSCVSSLVSVVVPPDGWGIVTSGTVLNAQLLYNPSHGTEGVQVLYALRIQLKASIAAIKVIGEGCIIRTRVKLALCR